MEAAELTEPLKMVVSIANAPCSYGAFEETVGVDPLVPGALEILDQVTAAGYAGIDLGPVGYLGDAAELPARLAERRLTLAGGFMELPYGDRDRLAEEIWQLDALLDTFDAAGSSSSRPAPRPTLAGIGSPAARLTSDGGTVTGALGRTREHWQCYADGVSAVTERCRARGYEPTFHHHVGTEVETPEDIDQLLSLTDVGLCLDTGHLAVASGDALEALRSWGTRINHVHMKDADLNALAQLAAEGAPVDDLWRGQVFVALGDGDLQCGRFLSALQDTGYEGWIVVEQDIFPQRGTLADKVRVDQERSRDFFTRHGL
jgi:inosose dehydratase